MNPGSLKRLCEEITAAAPGLRAAGVTSVEIGEVKFLIDPPMPTLADLKPGEEEKPEPDDPLEDPSTFSERGERLPRRRRPKQDDGE